MKCLRRSTLAAGLLALSLAPFGAVRADSLLEVTGTMLGGPQFETYTFEITQAGTDYVANLLDYLFPTDAFAYLGLAITQGAEVLGSIHGSGSFTFSADAAGTYTALVFGVLGLPLVIWLDLKTLSERGLQSHVLEQTRPQTKSKRKLPR